MDSNSKKQLYKEEFKKAFEGRWKLANKRSRSYTFIIFAGALLSLTVTVFVILTSRPQQYYAEQQGKYYFEQFSIDCEPGSSFTVINGFLKDKRIIIERGDVRLTVHKGNFLNGEIGTNISFVASTGIFSIDVEDTTIVLKSKSATVMILQGSQQHTIVSGDEPLILER